MSLAAHLYRLQKIETENDRANARLAEIERVLASDKAVHLAEEDAAQAEMALHKARQALREAEDSVHAQHVKIEQSEAALYSGTVKNPKELQDLQAEIAALKRQLAVLEDRQLEQMIEVEALEADLAKARHALEQTRAQAAQRQADLIAEQGGLRGDVERLKVERGATLTAIPPETLELFESLRRQKSGLAVAAVDESTCGACGATLTPAEWQGARSTRQITRCPSCGRILYAE